MGIGNEDSWLEHWDRKRRMAVAQVLCHAVHAVCIRRAWEHVQCDEEDDELGGPGNGEENSKKKKKKRNACVLEREFEGIKDAINEVAEAIREGNAVVDRAGGLVYSEGEVFDELVRIGVERHLRYEAYSFLTRDPARVRAFFGFPADERKDFLIQTMYGPEDP